MRNSSNFSKIVLFTLFYITTGISAAHALTDASKSQIISVAKTTCETAAQSKYGADSVKYVSDRIKWSKGHKGALVKMKIKPKAKKSQKYLCIVDSESNVMFSKN